MRLFISYAHVDQRKVRSIVTLLRKAGHDVWFDEQLVAGQDWQATLRQRIEGSDAFVYALSPKSVDSEWCQWEFSTAVKADKPVIPVLLEATSLPDALQKLQYVDFTRQTGEATAELMGGLLEARQKLPPQDIPNAPEHPKGQPAQAITQTVGDVSGGTVTMIGVQNVDQQTNIGTQIVGGEQRSWTLPVIIGLVIGIVTLVIGVIAMLPEPQRSNALYAVGLVPASATPTATATRTPTPTPTTTPTPLPTATPTPTLANYDVGIAVAYFALPADGSVDSIQADTLVEQVNARLTSELSTFTRQVDLTIGFIPPSAIGRITGETPAEREAQARGIAERYSADILLYGSITTNAQRVLEVQPEFYVSPDAFTEALEMAGTYRLGRGIEVEGSLAVIRNAMSVNRPLSARTSAIARIFAGLTYFLISDYDSALTVLEEVAASPEWEATEGQEVLNVLIGNVLGKQASVAIQQGDLDVAGEKLDEAVEEYQQAASITPDYSRAYTGLASSSYLRWSLDYQLGMPSVQPLQAALDYLDEAGDALDQSTDTSIQTKQLYTRAQVDYALWMYHANDLSSEDIDAAYTRFERTAEQIIRRYDSGRVPSMQDTAAETYALRGLIAYAQSDCQTGAEDFSQAVEITPLARRRMFFYGWLGDCYVMLNQSESALEAYESALALAEGMSSVSQDQIDRYNESIDALRGRG